MDEDAANLIVQAYQYIQALEDLLKRDSCSHIKEFIESGDTLSGMMNNAVNGLSISDFKTNLASLTNQIEKLEVYSEYFTIPENREIKMIFRQLYTSLSELQSKIDNRK
jgi:triacylglycerol esterase/lipase EstA (alpha/beta hydrolase family)